MQPTTTGPRSGGSRFFASPPRTCRISHSRQTSRPAKRIAGRKTAPGIFLRTTPKTHPANLPQVTETHQENSVTYYGIVLGCVVDPNSGDANAGSGNSKTTTAITGKGATGAGTETTGVNLNLYKSTDRQRISATKTQFPGVFYAVGSHGTSTQIQLPDGSFITAKDFAKMLLTDPALNYSKGTAIWLIGCETGAPIKGGQNFAQQLAAELQVHVMAPNTITWMDRGDGSVSVYYPKDRYANPMVEDKSRPGAWITY